MSDELKALWSQQPLEGYDMDLEGLHVRLRAQLARIRLARVVLIMGTLAGVSLAAYQAVSAPTVLLRIGECLLAVGFLLFLALGWRRLDLASPDTAEACVAFLRKSLALRHRIARGGWIVVIAPLLPGLGVMLIALVIASGHRWLQLAPIAALLVLWLAVMLAIQAREASKVAAEIAYLDQQLRE
jgi:hypothetical protein